MSLVEAENLGVRFFLERRELTLIRDVLLHPLRKRTTGRVFWALREASFRVEQGRVLGVIGENGAGKTTLLMALAGIYAPDEGNLRVRGRPASLLEIGAGFRWELTGRENVFLYGAIMGIPRRKIVQRFDEIVSFAGLESFIDSPMRAYSSGMRMRLGFSVALSMDPSLLLVDEALGIGDSAFQQRAMARIEAFGRQGGTLVYVSHDMNSVGRLCDECLLLENGRQIAFGETSEVIAAYWEGLWGKQVEERRTQAKDPEPDPLRGARRWGSGEVWIRRCSIQDEHGEPMTVLEQGRPFHVEILYQVEEVREDLVFQMGLFQGKAVVSVIRSDAAACPAVPAGGTGRVLVRVNTQGLPPGAYRVDAEIHNEAFTRMYDHLEKFTSLEVLASTGPRDESKLISLPCRWTFSAGEQGR